MIAFQPKWGTTRYRLGQISEILGGGVLDDVARSVVAQAEPAVRRIIHDERNRFAEALLLGIPWASGAAIAYLGTRYLLPDKPAWGKWGGYSAAAVLGAVGAWQSISALQVIGPPPKPTEPSVLDPVVERTAKAIVAEAEPRIRNIVDDEATRISTALQTGLPFAVASAAAFIATWLLVDEKKVGMKALGYSGSVLLFGAGAWFALEKEKERAAA